MRLLVDSHVALWWLAGHEALGENCREALAGADQVLFSAATPWELAIKRASGKIGFPDGLVAELTDSGFEELPIRAEHGLHAADLPPHHADPFDRMLVAQAQMEALDLVTADRSLGAYDVGLVDARV
ncbi:MAG: type II toxin-antitoxin system VapC family toxin [Acidimicrobiales bacterium]